MRTARLLLLVLLTSTAFVLTACGVAGGGQSASGSGAVTIIEPLEGALVSGQVDVDVDVQGLVVEPAGPARDGAGHIHVIVDVGCVTPGRSIPFDDDHIHLGDGSTSTVLELEPGPHTLCVQAGDGSHLALDLSDTVSFTVSD